ncbi:agouti-signaling protein-like [Pleuronectes platessa]|uniref:agouti-signaling protein-like n=1 Tax=Pleuronectes platessa TaxID=8262 RepID=UPI00232A503B|nr:agouti-signaling protein-like [Pleuronectes platessa]
MKVSLLCLCVLVHVCLVHAGLFANDELQQTASSTKTKTSQSTDKDRVAIGLLLSLLVDASLPRSSNHVRQRPLFARRGQYERQSVPKRKAGHNSQHGRPPPSKGVSRPVKPIMCSQVGQSCLPQSGCCMRHTICHCRFFNTICFCRRKQSVKKT